MGIELDDLPEKYRRIALEQLRRQEKPRARIAEDPPKKKSKYNAVKDERGEIRFDSRIEARRYDALVVMLRCGEIEDLRVQPEFTLTEAYTKPSGERVRAMRYRADFSYRKNGVLIVEDVKSAATKTQLYRNKRKLMYEKYGIEVQEVEAW